MYREIIFLFLTAKQNAQMFSVVRPQNIKLRNLVVHIVTTIPSG